MQDQGRSTRTKTGGRVHRHTTKKKKHQLGNSPTETQFDEPSYRTVAGRGNTTKIRALATNVANVTTEGETERVDIENVVDNPANPNYARRNIITKGAIIETELGFARVTSRPGQTGQVNAKTVDYEPEE
ncbi:30S ribosomal protein S8e [Halodesulfurarchaeum sp. HSR-GB]|uniref:30S ribosomal protein S8e n=1 Tax=Halodesulfurarchaeum sp. HSR-GB TaxID=3074077 RepID=UPI0028659AC4|nr:30S ribosomal protein S8e [Halodesulfurarchaeum sp. HSR-GB]MDR5655866.1 30S ribosomal protein S8e [Halodesulfurarchaeum sp. HSR-GB]